MLKCMKNWLRRKNAGNTERNDEDYWISKEKSDISFLALHFLLHFLWHLLLQIFIKGNMRKMEQNCIFKKIYRTQEK